MKLTRRANTIILWVISLGLVLGMIITFTPTLGGFGAGPRDASATALIVNGEPISELAVARMRSNPLFNLVTEGEVGADLEHLLADELIRQELVRQEAARQRVTTAEVRRAVDDFREARGVAGRGTDSQYLQILAASGFTDETFRAYLRQQLAQQKWEESLIAAVEVTDEEARAYFDANRDAYRTEERILARQIVLPTREDAEEVRIELLNGADAATVARERSIERADRDGALGAAVGETEPRPVGRPALPTAVASAAFALQGPGVTEVVEAAGTYHVVVVEEYVPPAQRPFEEVAAEVREDALDAKRAGVLDEAVRSLKAQATIEIPESSVLQYDNAPVARVGDTAITRSELVRATYTNPQIQQALSPDMAFIVTAFFKPAVLGQLIDQELAYQGAAELGVPFVGPRAFVAQMALNYVARDAEVDEAEVERYYEENRTLYTVQASADAVRVELPDEDAAEAFRQALLSGDDLHAAAEAHGGEHVDLGRVVRGQLDVQLDAALFATNAFEPLPDSALSVSDVLVLVDTPTALPEALEDEGEEVEEALPESTVVVLVAERTPERVRPLDEVRMQVEAAVLASARAEMREAWLGELRERIEVEEIVALSPDLDPLDFVAPDVIEEFEDLEDLEDVLPDGEAPEGEADESEADEEVPAAP
jgi:parvulin-like peptidyl-prolyl isomerase